MIKMKLPFFNFVLKVCAFIFCYMLKDQPICHQSCLAVSLLAKGYALGQQVATRAAPNSHVTGSVPFVF